MMASIFIIPEKSEEKVMNFELVNSEDMKCCYLNGLVILLPFTKESNLVNDLVSALYYH